jgi:hypothetical protein
MTHRKRRTRTEQTLFVRQVSAKFGGRIWGGILKRSHSLFSCVEGQFRTFTKVSSSDLTGNPGEIQIVEKD